MKKIEMNVVTLRHFLTIDGSEKIEDWYYRIGELNKTKGLPMHTDSVIKEQIKNVDVMEKGDRVIADIKRNSFTDEDGISSGGQWVSKIGTVVSVMPNGIDGQIDFDDGDTQAISLIRGNKTGYPGNNIEPIDGIIDVQIGMESPGCS